jgi:hypothetical protein
MGLALLNPPRISKQYWSEILQAAGSPAAAVAADCYDISSSYGLDPTIALAFFQHESSCGTAGVAVHSLNWGNLRKGARAVSIQGGFAYYNDWRDSLRDWCDLIRTTYIDQWGLDTVDKVIPRYAPAADGNVPTAYIAAVENQVLDWAASDPYGGLQDVNLQRLADALLRANYERAGAKYHPDWAFHQYANDQVSKDPLGAPLGDSYRIQVGGQSYAIQVYALDTLYTPIAVPESQTDWGVVKRMTGLQNP